MPVSEHVAGRAEARVGTLLRGKWRLDRVLGIGGMAAVYAATHRNQARVAIKMLHPEVSLDAEVTERFLREGYLANSVDHPGTVKVLDDDVSDDGAPFLVMELLEGETVESRWARKGRRLPVAEVLSIAQKTLEVLAAAHTKGVVHRDLKPDNLFLTRNGELKILDFGIARLHEVSKEATHTRAGSVMGTPAFMAPEQARGRWDDVDARTDIWALGATVFTLLSGRYVHDGETIQEQLILAATKPAPSLHTLLPELSPLVADWIDRALAYDRGARWPDARSMLAALAPIAGTDDAPERFTLPEPSSPGIEAQTIVAPPELTSAITGSGSLTTRAVTKSARALKPNNRGMLYALLALGVLSVLALVAWRLSGELPSDPVVAVPSPPEPAPTPVEIGPIATTPAEPIVKTVPSEPETQPRPTARPTRPTAPTAPVASQRPKPSGNGGASSALTGSRPSGDPPRGNPFDKRL